MRNKYSLLTVSANYVMFYDNELKKCRYLSYSNRPVVGIRPVMTDEPPIRTVSKVDQDLINILFEQEEKKSRELVLISQPLLSEGEL